MKKNRFYLLVLVALMFSIALVACNYQTSDAPKSNTGDLIVHFIDVGQGDSTFIEFPNGKTSLIDAGTRGAGDKVVEYLDDLNIKRIDYLIATHPHEDHIGGLPRVIKEFDIDMIYMPDKTSNTLIFEELLTEIQNKGLKITLGKGGDVIIDKDGLKYITLGPNRNDYSKINNFSIVTKIVYGGSSVIITGDAEKDAERDMLNSKYDLTADILRIGHHGGSSSTGREFLDGVKPEYSIISVGKNNSYNHPHKETLERLSQINTQILRTDELGDIIFVSDGKEFYPIENSNSEDKTKAQYIGNKNTKVFHKYNCGSLPNKENQIIFRSIKEAKDNKYRPHKTCVE